MLGLGVGLQGHLVLHGKDTPECEPQAGDAGVRERAGEE